MTRLYILFSLMVLVVCGHAQHWVEVGNLNANYTIRTICTDGAGTLYAAGAFTDSTDPSGGYKFVAKYDGHSWQPLGDSLHALRVAGNINALCADMAGNVYAAGDFVDSNNRTYVAMWNGISWQHLGFDTSGLNAKKPIYTLAVDAGHVYAAGAFDDSVFGYGHYYVAVWDGYWHELGLDSTAGLNANGAIYTLLAGPQHHIYAAGNFTDTSIGYYYVAEYNGTAWVPTGSGSHALRANNPILSLAADRSGNVYAAGEFTDSMGHFYIAKWDGTDWTMLRSAQDQISMLGPVYALAVDTAGYVYGGGAVPDSSGNYVTVVKWNGSYLSEAGGLLANDAILCMAADDRGNIFAAGNFKDPDATQYVAAYTTTILPTGIEAMDAGSYLVYPNPTGGILHIETGAVPTAIELRDISGRWLQTTEAAGRAAIDISAYSAGLYLLSWRSANGAVNTLRIVKE